MAIEIRISPQVTNEALNALFATAWDNYVSRDFTPVLSRSLLYVCAYDGDRLVGFVNLAWDGGVHAFLLDTTVHADYQRQGIGVMVVQAAIEAARGRGVEWIHVDYEPHLKDFYTRCGFTQTEAGLVHIG